MRGLRMFAVAALVLGASLITGTAAQAAPSAPYTVLAVESDWHDYTFESGVEFSRFGPDGINTYAYGQGGNYNLYISPPTGTSLTPGTYPTLRFADATHAGMDHGIDGQACSENELAGNLTIHEVQRNQAGDITAFAASYRFPGCKDMSGELRWNSSVGYKLARSSARSFGWDGSDIGRDTAAKDVTVTVGGTQPVTFGQAAFAGSAPGAFRIKADTCSGKVLAVGKSCTVSVAAHPTAKGAQTATLTVPDDTAGTRPAVSLSAFGIIGAEGTYYPVDSARILDTRSGNGAPAGKVGGASTLNLQVTGRGNIPSSGVSSVVLNVTVTEGTSASFLTVYPKGVSRPTASNLNFSAGWTGANSVTVRVGDGGQVSIYNHAGGTHVIVDVVGFYAANNELLYNRGLGNEYIPVKVERLLDSREWGYGPLDGGDQVTIPLGYTGLTSNIRAVAVNITAVDPTGTGFFTAWDGNNIPPQSSTLNFSPRATVPNMAVVPVTTCPLPNCSQFMSFRVYNHVTSSAHILVDIVGVYVQGSMETGLRFNPLSPTRITDTRDGLGANVLGPQSITPIAVPGAIAGPNTVAVGLNVTAVTPSEGTYLTLWRTGLPARPTASNLNPARGQTVPNATITSLGTDNRFNVYNHAGNTHLVIDVNGTFDIPPYQLEAPPALRGLTGRQLPTLATGRPTATRTTS
ncbi:choice-of-anchor D domain-containing protein [Longispora sp. NPDC051575]|uniref:choice-of-anchor D domain-containing protein n=1 Tax=Longispora sp. NPDC051575 TaxID=3154943 RepID=UPI0034161DCC